MTLSWAARRSAPRAHQQGSTSGRCTTDALLLYIHHFRGYSHNVNNDNRFALNPCVLGGIDRRRPSCSGATAYRRGREGWTEGSRGGSWRAQGVTTSTRVAVDPSSLQRAATVVRRAPRGSSQRDQNDNGCVLTRVYDIIFIRLYKYVKKLSSHSHL
jgi:hypothetical protein